MAAESTLKMAARALPTRLLFCLYCFKDLLECCKASDSWMTHNMVLCPIVEVVRKGADSRIMGSIIPPLDQQAVATLPMMTVLRHLERSPDFEDSLSHLYEVPIDQHHAIVSLIVLGRGGP